MLLRLAIKIFAAAAFAAQASPPPLARRFARSLFVLLAIPLLIGRVVPAQSKSSVSQTFQQLSEQAAKASEENRLGEAAMLYRKALALRPGWAEGWWSLGTLQYDQNQYAQA